MVCAGSRLVCMVYEKYVLGLGWHVQLFPHCKAKLPESDGHPDPTKASMIMLSSLSLWLQVEKASKCVFSKLGPRLENEA